MSWLSRCVFCGLRKRPSFHHSLLSRWFSFSVSSVLRPHFEKKISSLVAEFDQLSKLILSSQSADPATIQRWERLNPLVNKITDLELLRQATVETKEMLGTLNSEEIDEEELIDLVKQESKERSHAIEAIESDLLELMIPPDKYADGDVILEVNPGVGGQESMYFAEELQQLYIRYCAFRGWQYGIMETSAADFTMEVSGPGAFADLQLESGVHRVQRVPVNANVVHTSTAAVVVLPKRPDLENSFEVDSKDVIETMHHSSGKGGQHANKTLSAVRLKHVPTGITVDSQNSRSQHQNRVAGLELLRKKLFTIQMKQTWQVEHSNRLLQMGLRERSDKIRTYNFKQSRVTDHRWGISSSNLFDLLRGEDAFHEFILSLRQCQKEEKILAFLSSDGSQSTREGSDVNYLKETTGFYS